MSCKSAIYTANTGARVVAVGAIIPLGSIIRRFGCSVNLNGNGINLTDAGYYDISASITAAPIAVGTVTVTLFRNGVAVPGATASAAVSTAGNPVNLSISALVREGCCADGGTLTLVLTGASSTVSNIALVVEKI